MILSLIELDFSFQQLTFLLKSLLFHFHFFKSYFIYPWRWWCWWCYILSKTFSVYFETEWFMRSGLNGAIVKISVSNVKTSYNPNITFQNCCSLIIQENCPFLWRLLFDMNARTLSPYLTKPTDSLFTDHLNEKVDMEIDSPSWWCKTLRAENAFSKWSMKSKFQPLKFWNFFYVLKSSFTVNC